MSDDAQWDDSDYEAPPITKPAASDKWDGEDEDDEVKDNWDDEEEEEKSKNASGDKIEVAAAPKAKKLSQKIAEKEEKMRRQMEEKRQKQLAQKKEEPMSAEEAQAEKLRQKMLQEESDLEIAKETLGVTDLQQSKSLDAMNPTSKEDFDEYRRIFVAKFNDYEKSTLYVTFLDELFRDLCIDLEPDDIKKINSTLTALTNEKVKALKVAKGKKKATKKASLNVGKNAAGLSEYGAEEEYDEFDFI